jgi:hypothetical protein
VFPAFFAARDSSQSLCIIHCVVLQGFIATVVNFALSLWMPLTKEVAMGKGERFSL